jgi:hypothetical protein
MKRSGMRRDEDADWTKRLLALHRRCLRKEKTAFKEITILIRPLLLASVGRRCRRKLDPQLIESAVDVALMSYRDNPRQFQPNTGLRLDSFLAMAAVGIVKHSLRGDTRRVAREQIFVKDKINRENRKNTVALGSSAGNITSEGQEKANREALDSLMPLLSTPRDKKIFQLMSDGVRGTRPYAMVMGIAHLPPEVQERRVKRAKDRIKKELQRKARAAGITWTP